MYETDNLKENVILIAIDKDTDKGPSVEESLLELAELVKTSEGVEVGKLIQKREKAHSSHYFGKGKVEELKDLISVTGANAIVSDDELSGVQQKNLGKLLDVKIMDRTMIILDIFAQRAATAEGKVQVELAQLKYNLSHLAGIGKELSRLGGGIGTRGPGEKKLETDRRHIKNRLTDLNNQLKDIETHREILREKRRKTGIPTVSLVGYTNAGKSTLMNVLTKADVLAEDKLFVTLDTTTRKTILSGGSPVLFTDTVGFIQKLPHQLIKAFRATLEELKYADILIHVVDASNSTRTEQMAVVYSTLKVLGVENKPIITCFNKMDLEVEKPLPLDNNAIKCVQLSAAENDGIYMLVEELENVLKTFKKSIKVIIPYDKGSILNIIYDCCEIVCEEHRENGTFIELFADEELLKRLNHYIIR